MLDCWKWRILFLAVLFCPTFSATASPWERVNTLQLILLKPSAAMLMAV